MHIGIDAIGVTQELAAVAMQIGVTRIGGGGRVIPRNVNGRFVALRKLVAVTIDVATLTDLTSIALPAKRLATATVRAVATVTALVVTGVVRPVLASAQRILDVLVTRVAAPLVRTAYACIRASWHEGTFVFPWQLDDWGVRQWCRGMERGLFGSLAF